MTHTKGKRERKKAKEMSILTAFKHTECCRFIYEYIKDTRMINDPTESFVNIDHQ